MAEGGDGGTGGRRGHDDADQHRQVADPRVDSARTLHGLEPDRDVVAHDEEAAAEAEGVRAASPDGAVPDDPGWYCGVFLLDVLEKDED